MYVCKHVYMYTSWITRTFKKLQKVIDALSSFGIKVLWHSQIVPDMPILLIWNTPRKRDPPQNIPYIIFTLLGMYRNASFYILHGYTDLCILQHISNFLTLSNSALLKVVNPPLTGSVSEHPAIGEAFESISSSFSDNFV